jgi:ABC-2 type transport system permease protein
LSSLLRLVVNEQQKIYARLRTWIMLAILVLSVISLGALMKFVINAGIGHVLTFMDMAVSLSSLVFIFTIILAGDIVASEFSWGTIKLLLIRPASRSKILLSKYVSVLLFLVVQLVLVLVFSYFTGLLFFGVSGPLNPGFSVGELLGNYGLETLRIVMAATMAFMISTVFRSSSLAIGISIFLMFTATSIVAVLARLNYSWVKYVLFANTDLTPYFSGGKPIVPGMTLGFSVTMLVIYWVLFYAISWFIFTRRDVAGA